MILRIYIHVTSMNLNTYSIQDHYVVYGVNTDFISLFMLLFTMLLHAAGCMFYGKPLYIAFAQRKEDRKTQLKLHYAPQQARLNGSPATVIPPGFTPYFYPNVTSHVFQSGLLYQPLGLGSGWRANDFTPPTRPFQPSQVPIVSIEFTEQL